MEDARGGSQGRRLRAVGEGPVTDPGVLGDAIVECASSTPGGVVSRALAGAVAARLGVAVSAVSPQALAVALGLAIATGRVDEAGGRLVPLNQEHRRAG